MTRRFAILPFIACSLVIAVACSSSTSTPDATNTGDAAPSGDGSSTTQDGSMGTTDSAPAQDSATVDASDAATDDSGLLCGTVANTAPVINDTIVASTVPVGTGGTIVDGVYFLTATTNYLTSSVTPKSHTYTANLVGTAFGLRGHDNADPEGFGGFTITSSNTGTISMVGNCPTPNVGKIFGAFDSYTATTTTLTLYSSSKANSAIFTKQ